MGRIDRGARSDTRQRRQGQRDAEGLGFVFGDGLIYNSGNATVSVKIGTGQPFTTTAGLALVLNATGGLAVAAGELAIAINPAAPLITTGGLALVLATNSGLAVTANALEISLDGSTLTRGAGGLSVTAPAGQWTVTAIKTGAYTAAWGELVRVDATLGGFTVTLPAAAGASGRKIMIKEVGNSTNVVTVDGNAAETIDGAATVALSTAYGAAEFVSDGTNVMAV